MCLFTICKQFPTKEALAFYTALIPIPAIAEMLTNSWQTMHDSVETREVISGVSLVVTVTCIHSFRHTNEVIYQNKRQKIIPIRAEETQTTEGLLNKVNMSMERSKIHRTDRWMIH